MATVRELHVEAMKIADRALMAERAGRIDDALVLNQNALELERQAAFQVPKSAESEPSRSILFRSAATLALELDDVNEATRLLAEALTGWPSSDLREELFGLLEQIKFMQHIEERRIDLEPAQLDVSFDGDAIGDRSIEYSAWEDRISSVMQALRRTAERMLNIPFVGFGPPSSKYPFAPYLSTGVEGSYAVTVELRYRHDQTIPMLLETNGEQVVDEYLRCAAMAERQNFEELELAIPDRLFRNNFYGQMKRLAPDGRRVKVVGLTSPREQIQYTRTVHEHGVLPSQFPDVITPPMPIVPIREGIRGIIDEAIGHDGQSTLRISPSEGSPISIRAGEDFGELVRGYFHRNVDVVVDVVGKDRMLVDIAPAD